MKEKEKIKANELSIKVVKSAPRIKKVELVNGGIDGLRVTYTSLESRNMIQSPIDSVENYKRPVQFELRNYFSLLKEHLLGCCGYHWSNDTVLEMYKANVSVDYVLIGNDDKFQLGGKNRVKLGIFALNSPLCDSLEYDEWDELEAIIGKIILETNAFISGAKGADSRLITIDYMKVKKNVLDAEKSYEEMSEEERDAMMKEAFGSHSLDIIEEDGKMVIGVKEEEDVVVDGETELVVEKDEDNLSFIEDGDDSPLFIEDDEPIFEAEAPVVKKGKK